MPPKSKLKTPETSLPTQEPEEPKKRIFKIILLLPSLFAMVSAALCGGSFWVATVVSKNQLPVEWADAYEQEYWSFESSQGTLHFFHGAAWTKQKPTELEGWHIQNVSPYHLNYYDDQTVHTFDRIGVGANILNGSLTGYEVMFPHWLLFFVFFTPYALSILLKWRLRRRIAIGSCVVCGYDLRATTDRCPECGTTK